MDPDALLHPVGPLPPYVYWRRRLVLLLAGLVALIVLVSLAGGGNGGGASPLAASTSPSPRASASASQAASPAASPSASASTTAACATGTLTVSASTDAASYPAGTEPRLVLTVRNPGAAPCTADLGPARLELRVLSGSDRIWSSDDCAPGGAPAPTTLPAGGTFSTGLHWARLRSAPGCPSGEPAALPGTYRVVARLGDQVSAPAVFSLR